MLALLCYLLTIDGYNTFSKCLVRLYQDQHPQQDTIDIDPTLIVFRPSASLQTRKGKDHALTVVYPVVALLVLVHRRG